MRGLSGAGKTTLIEAFCALHPDRATIDGDIREVVTVEMPEAATKRALVSAILHELGYAAKSSDTANAIIDDVIDKVERIGVKMIILDEGHHVFQGKSVQAVSEFLKSLLNRVKCQIVICGTPEILQIRSNPQLDRRLAPDIVLEPYNWTEPSGRLEYVTLLDKFERLMEMPEASNFAKADFARRIYVATGGMIGMVSKYISRAVELCAERNLPMVDLPLMAEIYASWHPDDRIAHTIDFEAPILLPSGTTIEGLATELRTVRFDPEANPFSCSPKTLSALWSDRTSRRPVDVSPRRRVRGRGADQPKAFS